MRLLSTVAFAGLVSAASISPHLAGRANCNPGEGRESSTSGKCITCPVGTFGRGGSATCTPCPGGSSSTAGSSYCTCSPGYSKLGGTTTSTACTACAAGTSSDSGAWYCTSCPANTYSVSTGQCTACPAGTSSPSGASQCTSFTCQAGKYTSGNTCATCPAGTYSSASSTSCTSCPAGQISNAGSGSCVACPGGSIPTSAGSTCMTCPANTYSSGNQCASCPGNAPGSSSCGPQPSKRAVQPVLDTCSSMPGYQRCPVLSGSGGSECINTLTTLDSCGGCVGLPGEEDELFTGQDCSTIKNVDEVRCNNGRCQVISCQAGYVFDQLGCVPISHTKARRGHGHESF